LPDEVIKKSVRILSSLVAHLVLNIHLRLPIRLDLGILRLESFQWHIPFLEESDESNILTSTTDQAADGMSEISLGGSFSVARDTKSSSLGRRWRIIHAGASVLAAW
jgi:hypothetical protein